MSPCLIQLYNQMILMSSPSSRRNYKHIAIHQKLEMSGYLITPIGYKFSSPIQVWSMTHHNCHKNKVFWKWLWGYSFKALDWTPSLLQVSWISRNHVCTHSSKWLENAGAQYKNKKYERNKEPSNTSWAITQEQCGPLQAWRATSL